MRGGLGLISAGGATLTQLATGLTLWVDRIVVDKTALAGSYDFFLHWTPTAPPRVPLGIETLPPPDPDGPSLFAALDEQLGLKLEATRGPVEILVIDRAEHPAEN